MAFCTNCGAQVADTSRFCANCGYADGSCCCRRCRRSLCTATSATATRGCAVMPLKYDVEGHNLQIARVHLQPGQEIYAEAGKMIYKSSNVDWTTRMTGQSIGDKILGALKRKMMGDSLFFTYFRSNGVAGRSGFCRPLSRQDSGV